MKRTAVSSTSIASIGYDPITLTMEIEFKRGNIYQYFDVPQHVYDDLMSADSHGKFFNLIKGRYRYARL